MKRLLLILLLLASPAYGQTSEDETRARAIGEQLRCVVCQNQSIEESDAPLAQDMRLIVRESIQSGKTDAEIIADMRARYGDYVLLKPPVQSNTYVLWFLPAGFVLLGGIWFILRSRQKMPAVESPTLSAEDKALLDKLLRDDA